MSDVILRPVASAAREVADAQARRTYLRRRAVQTTVTTAIGLVIFVVIAVLYAGYRKRRLVQETISQYLASGKDVPPEILESIHGGAEKPKNYLQKGFVMVGTGLGIFLCFAIMGEIGIASLGVIPLFIGLAQILIWKLEKPDHGPRG